MKERLYLGFGKCAEIVEEGRLIGKQRHIDVT